MENGKIVYFNSVNTKIYGKFYFPKNFNNNIKSQIVMMATGDGKKGSSSSTWKPLIDSMIEINIPVFIFDFYSLGNSEGDIKKFTPTIAIQNLLDALEIVKKQRWVDSERIGMLASSFGGAISLIVQSLKNPFKIIGLKSPVSFFAEVYESEFRSNDLCEWKQKGIIDDIPFHYNAYTDCIQYNIYDMIKNINSKVLIVHGDIDNIVPLSQSIRLSCLLKKAQLKVLENVNHGYKEEGSLNKLIEIQKTFFKKNL